MIMKKILVIHGPNLNLLGQREKDIYGQLTLEQINARLLELAKTRGVELAFLQSNHEGDLIDKIQGVGYRYDGIILNAAGFTHTSIAIADALRAITTPVVEVHISNIYQREIYRHTNYIKESAIHSIVGHGLAGYKEAIEYLRYHVINK